MWLVSAHYRKPIAFSEEALAQAEAGVRTLRELGRRLDQAGPADDGMDALAERFFDALADDFNTPEARAALSEWVAEANRRLDAGERLGPGRLPEMLYAFGLEGLLDADHEAPDEVRELARERDRARAARDFAAADRLRDELAERGWEVRDTPDGRAARTHAVIVYGRNPVREALRGRRSVEQVWATESTAGEPWLEGVAVAIAGADEIERLSESPEHQGICAEAAPYPYADADCLLEPEDALVLCLDEVQDPHNLGAVCRVAETAGCAGLVIPERRSAAVTASGMQGVGRRGGAPPGGARAQPGRLARQLPSGPAPGSTARTPGPPCPYDAPDYAGRVVLVLGSEGRGLRPRVAAACDQLVALPVRGQVGSLNVSTAAAALVYTILHLRAALDRAP